MLWINKNQIVGFVAVFAGAVFWVWGGSTDFGIRTGVVSCTRDFNGEQEINCVYSHIEQEMRRDGIVAAMEVFTRAYEVSKTFARSGCHRHAHRVGDMFYYEHFRGRGLSLENVDFPQETTACGYGFFHGFFEHLVQDNPDPDFVDSMCALLHERFSERLPAIRITCYHGSGHGFMHARAEAVSTQRWGDIHAFATEPLAMCERMEPYSVSTRLKENIIKECKEGVFNVLVDWMADGEYGFSYENERPFAVCDWWPLGTTHSACYYEMAQKIGGPPDRVAQRVESIQDEQLQMLAFSVGLAGAVQVIIVDDGHFALMSRCKELPGKFWKECISSIVHGLFEHGAPQQEYRKALTFCASEEVSQTGLSEWCYETTVRRLSRFYTSERIALICREFPSDVRNLCSF